MVSDLKTFAHKGGKIAAQKKFVLFLANFALLAGFFGISATIGIGQEMLCLPYAEFLTIDIANELGQRLLNTSQWKHVFQA